MSTTEVLIMHNFKDYRIKLGLSQREISLKLQLSLSTVCRYEADERKAPHVVLKYLDMLLKEKNKTKDKYIETWR